MDRDALRTLVLAALAVLALAVAAATLTDAVAVGGEGSSLGGGSGGGVGDDDGEGLGEEGGSSLGSTSSDLRLDVCVKWLTDPLVAGGILLFLLGVGAAEWYLTKEFLVGFAVFVMVAIPVGFVYYLLTACRGVESQLGLAGRAQENLSIFPGAGAGGGGSGAGGAASTVSQPQVALLLVLGLAILVAVGLVLTGTGDDDPPAAADADEGPPEPDVAAVGRVAGDAADRISGDAAVENEVYRAWREMTDHLDVANPHSSTPAEFAEAAVDAGMARDDVDDLTEVFEAVRYGPYEPTADREERAVAALRRIEAAYAGGDASAEAPGADAADDGVGGR